MRRAKRLAILSGWQFFLIQILKYYTVCIGLVCTHKVLSYKVSFFPQTAHSLYVNGNSSWPRRTFAGIASFRARQSCASDLATWGKTSSWPPNCLRHLTNIQRKDFRAAAHYCAEHKDFWTPCGVKHEDFWAPLSVKCKDTKSREASE